MGRRQASGTTSFLPYCTPCIGEEEIAEVVDTLRSGCLSAGPKTSLFEKEFANYVGANHAVAVNSCTSALGLALAAIDIRPGDEVIVPTLTFCATANVVEHRGATPVIVDIGADLQIEPDAVAKAVSPRTRAIIPVHYAGQACNLSRIEDIAASRGLTVIQDAAHAVGATYGGHKVGAGGCITAFSFYPTKNMTTGEGGMLTTNDPGIAARLRRLAVHGIHYPPGVAGAMRSWLYEVREPGYKVRMPDLQAAIGLHQLRKLDGFIARRRYIAERYTKAFQALGDVVLPGDLPDRPHTYHLYPLMLAAAGRRLSRNNLIRHLFRLGIGSSVHYVPLHRHPFYRTKYRYSRGAFPVADAVCPELISIPLYPAMSDADADRVVDGVCRGLLSMGSRSAGRSRKQAVAAS